MATQKQTWDTIRAHFIANGSSVTSWCRENKVEPSNLKSALKGSWTGPRATKLVEKVKEEVGLAA